MWKQDRTRGRQYGFLHNIHLVAVVLNMEPVVEASGEDPNPEELLLLDELEDEDEALSMDELP